MIKAFEEDMGTPQGFHRVLINANLPKPDCTILTKDELSSIFEQVTKEARSQTEIDALYSKYENIFSSNTTFFDKVDALYKDCIALHENHAPGQDGFCLDTSVELTQKIAELLSGLENTAQEIKTNIEDKNYIYPVLRHFADANLMRVDDSVSTGNTVSYVDTITQSHDRLEVIKAYLERKLNPIVKVYAGLSKLELAPV